MTLEAISSAAAVALASTIVYLLIARSWQLVSRSVGHAPRFADSIMREAAQRFRDELEKHGRKQSTYRAAALLFVLLFAVAYTFQAQVLFSGYPRWQMYALLGVSLFAALLAVKRLTEMTLARRRLKIQRDANVAIGHQLRQISPLGSRVYHEVPTANGIVDHVVVGQSGVYAVTVFARRPQKHGTVELNHNELLFQPGADTVSIVDSAANTSRLQRELRDLLGHKVRVRSVIAVPGWEISAQRSEKHLLVNERCLAMLTGWKDESDYLMNEDAAALISELADRCSGVV